jgi:threonine aldolase
MKEIIDLRSDTVTRPTPEMWDYMSKAKVGDDVLGDDPTVMELERKVAGMFGMEEALFCPSGTMTNQVAVKVHTKPGDEVICDITSHVYNFEGGGMAFNSGCSIRTIQGEHGLMRAKQVEAGINPPENVHYPFTSLVVAENTSNKGGGSIYNFKDLQEIGEVCRKHNLKYHLDGARIFNALAETPESPLDYGRLFDSISICLSKGLGAPVGSVLVGNAAFIRQARRVRKVFGGGMRQSGYLAAAGIYALDNHIPKLKEDHRRAKEIAAHLMSMNYVEAIAPVASNIIIFKLKKEFPDREFMEESHEAGLWSIGFGPQTVRLVTHLDFTDLMLTRACEILTKLQR